MLCVNFATGQVLQSVLGGEPTSLSQPTLGSVYDFRVSIEEAFQGDSIFVEMDSITLNGRLLQQDDWRIKTSFRRLEDAEGELILQVVSDAFLLPGLYTVRNRVLISEEVMGYHYQSFIIEPAELEVKAPLELRVLKGDPLDATLFVEEISGVSGIWDLHFKPVSWADSKGEVQLVEVQFAEEPPRAIEEDGVHPIPIQIPLESMPVGSYTARFYLDSDNISSPVPVLIDVTVLRGMGALFFALLAGLLLSFTAKIYLDARQRRNALLSDVVHLKKTLVDLESSYEDADFRAFIKSQHGPLDAVGHGLLIRIDADLKTIGDVRTKIERETESLDSELYAIQEELEAWYESLSAPFSLPENILDEIDALKPTLDDAISVLDARNRSLASTHHAAVHEQISILREKMRSMGAVYNAINLTSVEAYLVKKEINVVSWRHTIDSMNTLASHKTLDPAQLQSVLQLGNDGHRGALAMYRTLTESLEKELRVAMDEYNMIESEDGHSMRRLIGDLIEVLNTTDSQEMYASSVFSEQVFSKLIGQLEQKLEVLGQHVRGYIGSISLREENRTIRERWMQGDFAGTLSTIAQDMRYSSEDQLESARGNDLELEAVVRPGSPKSVEPPPAPPLLPKPEAQPSRGTQGGGLLRKAWDKLTTRPLQTPSPVPLTVRDVEFRAWKSAVLGKVVHTAIFGALAMLMGYITFAPDFTGTLPDFAAAIFWAFGLDFSAGAFLERTELG